jgi:hypothetical protein
VKQSRLDRAVARATGESLSVIRRMGFSVIGMPVRRSRLKPVAERWVKRLAHDRDA